VIHELLQRAGALERNGQHALAMLVEAECVAFSLEMPE